MARKTSKKSLSWKSRGAKKTKTKARIKRASKLDSNAEAALAGELKKEQLEGMKVGITKGKAIAIGFGVILVLALTFALGVRVGLEQGWVEGHHSQHTENQHWQVRELPSGQIVKHGAYVEYYPDGKTVKESGDYFMDKKQGAWSEYAPSGELTQQASYDNGEIVGKDSANMLAKPPVDSD